MLPSKPIVLSARCGSKPARMNPGANTAAAAPAAPWTKRRAIKASSEPTWPPAAEAAA